MIADEITHWYKDDKGENHRTSLRIEADAPQMYKGFPRDGTLSLRLTNTIGAMSFRLSPDESLRLATLLMALARESLLSKRVLWQQFEE